MSKKEEDNSAQTFFYGVTLLMILLVLGACLISFSMFQPSTTLPDKPVIVRWYVVFDKEEVGTSYLNVWDHHKKRNRVVATVKNKEQIFVLRVDNQVAKVKVKGSDIIGWLDLKYLDRREK